MLLKILKILKISDKQKYVDGQNSKITGICRKAVKLFLKIGLKFAKHSFTAFTLVILNVLLGCAWRFAQFFIHLNYHSTPSTTLSLA